MCEQGCQNEWSTSILQDADTTRRNTQARPLATCDGILVRHVVISANAAGVAPRVSIVVIVMSTHYLGQLSLRAMSNL